MFDPFLGRWMQDDPISFAAGDANLYRFVGNNPVNLTDPSGLDPAGNDSQFRDAAKRNGVSDEITDLIVDTAKATKVPPPHAMGVFAEHNYCEQWADAFDDNLRKALIAKGYKDGLKFATKGAITGPLDKTFFYVPGDATGNTDLLCRAQDHTALRIRFKDGTDFYIDCTTLSSCDVNNLTHGPSHFCPADKLPQGWMKYPLATPPHMSKEEAREFDRKFPGSAYNVGPKW